MSHVIKKDLGLGAFNSRTGQLLTESLKNNKVSKSKIKW